MNINVDIKQKVTCGFQIEKFKEDGTITYKGPGFQNTVLDCGLDLMNAGPLNSSNILYYINVGSGAGPVSISDTGLANHEASSRTIYSGPTITYSAGNESLSELPCNTLEKTGSFDVGFLSTETILTELGISRLDNSNYFNRQMIAPAALTVKADEGLRITGKLYVYADMYSTTPISGSFEFTDSTDAIITIDYWKYLNTTNDKGGTEDYNNYSMLGGYVKFKPIIGVSYQETDMDPDDTIPHNTKTFQSYVPGSAEQTITSVGSAGTLNGDIKQIILGIGDTVHTYYRLDLYFLRLEDYITVSSIQELTLVAKLTGGRYTP